MKKLIIALLAICFMTTGAFAQESNPPKKVVAHTKIIKKRTAVRHKRHHVQPIAQRSRTQGMRTHTLNTAYVKGKHSYRPEDNEDKINGGHAQNMQRNTRYQNTSEPSPASTGGK